MAELPKLIAISGPLKGQSFDVDTGGVRLAEDCIVRLTDGRVVAYGVHDGKERPRSLLDHKAILEAGSSEFCLEHPEIDPDVVFGMFPDFPDTEIESFFLGLLMEKIARPVAAAVLLNQWNAGERAQATFLPGFFYPRYTIVHQTLRQRGPAIYDETEQVFCARLSGENHYLGSLYVRSLTPSPFRREERIEIVRIAAYLSLYLATKDDLGRTPNVGKRTQEEKDEEDNREHTISVPAELAIVIEDMQPAYRFGRNQKQPVMEEVPSPLEELLEGVLSATFQRIKHIVGAAALLQIPGRPLHFVRLQRPADLEVDKDVIYRAFTLNFETARNADGSVWAVPMNGNDGRLGVLYVQLEEPPGMQKEFLRELEAMAAISLDSDFPKNLDRLF